MGDSASRFRTMTAVDKPLLVPTALQSPASDFTEHSCELRSAESSEANLSLRVDIHAAGIDRSAHAGQYEVGHKVGLIEDVFMGPSGEVSPAMLEAQL